MRSAMLAALALAEYVVTSRAIMTRGTFIDASSLVFIDDLVDDPDDVHLGEDDGEAEQTTTDPVGQSAEEPWWMSLNRPDSELQHSSLATPGQSTVTGATESSGAPERPATAEPGSKESSGAPERPVGTTRSPQQRAEAHASKYEAEFVVELNIRGLL
ncbi:unnamed protein product [Prorocentrum cordatum]|uniref:Secreted protein n=1 Tax=Prorocentrum cordatum TaxID=2364126 RepID=A0ABN9QVE8_9DINO|nr:unnamed protein product [Polarella glacialis]